MNERLLKNLYDILLAINEIDAFYENNKKDFDLYTRNVFLKRAIERNLEIIGESMSRILKEDSNFYIPYSTRIISLRNQIVNGYDSVSDENVWGIVINLIPELKEEVLRYINSAKTSTIL